ncbi:uncharacterized protein LOC131858902 [Cryptomeria japonica]|uniref:uncharacterized protein LOC131858902 n=1 Tax=Cryptomeria japonica TaxID=3369 RepID=UPI0027D9D334|nr:uncharacterized protein LOC131858902 [Cryptomeria japonica]
MAVQWKILDLRVLGDSQLVIKKVNDDYKTNDEKLMPYKRMVDDFKAYFTTITFEKIPRDNNRAADAMATIASLVIMPSNAEYCEFLVEPLLEPVYNVPQTQMICLIVGPNSQWYGDIYAYLHDNTLPLDLSNKA